MEKIGTDYGGWDIPTNIKLNKDSIIYSAGVGEDISFDLLLQDKYKSNIFLIDPTNRSKIHYQEIKEYYKNKIWKFSGDIQVDYQQHIQNLNIDISKINYIDKGLWNINGELKFFKQNNEKYVSQSLIPNMFGKNFDLINVTTIKSLMQKYNHTKIDLLKMDIEGSEINVLNNMLDDKIYPKYLCIEFDLFLKKKDKDDSTHKLLKRLENAKYILICNNNYNITLEYTKH